MDVMCNVRFQSILLRCLSDRISFNHQKRSDHFGSNENG